MNFNLGLRTTAAEFVARNLSRCTDHQVGPRRRNDQLRPAEGLAYALTDRTVLRGGPAKVSQVVKNLTIQPFGAETSSRR